MKKAGKKEEKQERSPPPDEEITSLYMLPQAIWVGGGGGGYTSIKLGPIPGFIPKIPETCPASAIPGFWAGVPGFSMWWGQVRRRFEGGFPSSDSRWI
eukprot:1385950-Amorphochlora_amoeboformis.AAC.1